MMLWHYRFDHEVHSEHLRVRTVLLGVGHSQTPDEHHEDLKLSKFLDVVHSKLDASLDFNVSKLCRVEATYAAADLRVCYKRENKVLSKSITLDVAHQKKPLLSKTNMAAQLRLAKLHLNKPQDFWNNVLWTDQTKAEMS